MTERATRKRASVAERIAGTLRERISSGVYLVQSYLPPIRALAREFGAGTKTVGEALGILMVEGLVVKTRGRGTRVLGPQERLSHRLITVVYSPPQLPLAVGSGQAWIVDGIQQTLTKYGYAFEPLNYTDNPLSVEELLLRYGAIVAATAFGGQETILEIEARRIPFVMANLEWDWEVASTWVDHRKATLHAVRTLVALGHRRIGFVTRSPRTFFYGKSREGYVAGLEEAGIPFAEDLVVESEGHDNLTSYFTAKRLLKVDPAPTAIVAARDYHAHGAYTAFTEAGYVVGRDVSLIGFDDVTWPTGREFLTTYREPNFELGVEAARMLIERIVHGWRPPEKRELECPFLLRRSAGPVPPPVPQQPRPVAVSKADS